MPEYHGLPRVIPPRWKERAGLYYLVLRTTAAFTFSLVLFLLHSSILPQSITISLYPRWRPQTWPGFHLPTESFDNALCCPGNHRF